MTTATLLDQYRQEEDRIYTKPEALRYCADLATSHYENFSVVSKFLPKDLRQDFFNVYAFCRWADDLGDEMGSIERAKKELDWWATELNRCYDGQMDHPVFIALSDTIKRFDIPITPFANLIKAFQMDQDKPRHATYEDLLYYCRHSANPVGHLVLYLSEYKDNKRQELSDYTCTALQLTNFWQDVARDYKIGRIYLPQEDMARFSYTEDELFRNIYNENFRNLMAFEVDRTRALFHEGLKLLDLLDGRVKRDVHLFSLGGMKILEKIESLGYDVLSKRPVLTKFEKMQLMLGRVLPKRGS